MEEQELKQTPSQTVGPFFAYGLTPEQYNYDFPSLYSGNMVPEGTGHEITISGKVYDGEGKPVPDAMIEIWQNDGKNALIGRFGTGTDPDNQFLFRTIKPESVDGEAPFVTFIVMMRGQLIHSYTRIYFEDEKELNDRDTVLGSVPKDRRQTLIGKSVEDGHYVFDVHMQGEKETVFFAV